MCCRNSDIRKAILGAILYVLLLLGNKWLILLGMWPLGYCPDDFADAGIKEAKGLTAAALHRVESGL